MGIVSFISKDYKINKNSCVLERLRIHSMSHVFAQINRSKGAISVTESISRIVWWNFVLLPLKSLKALPGDRTLASDWKDPTFPVLRDWNISPETTESLPWPPFLPRKAKAFSCSRMGKNQLSCWSPEKHGFISSDGLAEHRRNYRPGCGHSKLDLALQCARISHMSITKTNTTIKPNSNLWCICLDGILLS